MNHRHVWDEDVPEAAPCVEIAPDVCLTPMVGHPAGRQGFWLGHAIPTGEARCMGAVPTCSAADGPVWAEHGTLEGGDLTLSPSVNCIQPTGAGRERHGPDFHGWVRDGKWVSA